MRRTNSSDDRSVAIVGVGCRLPGGINDLDALWTALAAGRDLVGRVPQDRFEVERFVDEAAPRPNKSYTAAGAFLDDLTAFDAAYFGISPKEAVEIDPQQRLLLETTAEALDDAGIAPARLAGTDTGVFIGISDTSYGLGNAHAPGGMNAYTIAGGALSIAANRVSHAFDLCGPSMAIDTACSSSLTALERACRELTADTPDTADHERSRDGARGGRVALAGGVNVLLGPMSYVGFSQASMLSRAGRCASFSAEADGFVRGEGGAVVVLKRLSDALADGDRVHGVITGWGGNCDGRTTGLALPNPHAQEALLRRVYGQAGIAPDELAYLEAHGTGTRAGDAAECLAIGRAIGARRTGGALPIGSVKSNLGHLEPASGMAGLLKALLVVRHRRIPASLHADTPNPDIDFAGLGLEIVTRPRPLDGGEHPYVGVSSAGFGGANAHVIVTSAPPQPRPAAQTAERAAPDAEAGTPRAGTPQALPVIVSAGSPEALNDAVQRMADRLADTPPQDFYDLAYTSCVRRGKHPYRVAVTARDPAEAAERLLAASGDRARVRAADRGRVGLVYCGNGSQWAGMGADLLTADAGFAQAVERADAALLPHLGWSVAERLAAPPSEWRLEATEVAQPLLFAVQVGLTEMLRARGVVPAGAVGHSVGETAAAWAAGALTLEDAALVVAARSRAQAPTAGNGRMAAVGLAPDDAEQALAAHDGLHLAAVNSEHDVTVTGPEERLHALGRELTAANVFFRMLDLDHAFHSSAMDPVRAPLTSALTALRPSAPETPLASTVTGELVTGPDLDAGYWWRNVREPVLFAAAVRRLLAEGVDVLVEVGPHPVLHAYLTRIGRTTASGVPADPAPATATLRRDAAGPDAMERAVTDLLASGADPDWDAFFPCPGRVVSLPAYPWQRERHWRLNPQVWLRTSGDGRLDHPLLGERLPAAGPCWQGPVEPVLAPWLPDHRVGGAIVWPGTGYVEMALAAGRRALGGPAEVVRLELTRMLVVDWAHATDVRLQTSVAQRGGAIDITSTRTSSGNGDAPSPPRQHARGRVRTLQGRAPDPIDVPAVQERCGRHVEREQHYQACDQAGLSYGPAFQVLEELWAGTGEVLAAYRHTHPAAGLAAGLEVHPALLDGALQAGAPLLAAHAAAGATFLPAKFGAVRVWRTPSAQGWVHVRDRTLMAEEKCWDITVTDPDGTVTVELRGVRLRRLPGRDQSAVQTYRTVMRAAPHEHRPTAPSPLPSPERLAAGAADQIDRLRSAWHGLDYERVRRENTAMLAHVTRDLIAGLLDDATAPFTLADLTGGRTAPWLGRWAAMALPLMREHDLAAQVEAPAGAQPERWRLLPDDARMADLWREVVEGQPLWISSVALGVHLLRNLPAILNGERAPLQMLLDGGAAEQLRRFYDLNPMCRFHNRVVRALLEQIVEAWPADRPLRILEIGAGTGGLTAALLPVLPPERTRYTFTDVSAFFLDGAQQRFTGYDFVDYRTFDLDTDPAPQGFTPGGYDLLVAGNALHTGREIRATLRRTAALLAPGGHLLAFEHHAPAMLLPLFGTLDSFWAAAGDPDRDAAVMIERERWPALLRDCGFPDLVQTGDDQGSAAADASVLLARTAADAAPADAAPAAGPSPETVPSARGRHVVVAETTGELPLARATAALLHRHGAATVQATHAAQANTDPALWEALLRGDDHDPHDDHDDQITVTLLLGDPDTPQNASGDAAAEAVEQTVRRAAILRAIVLAYRRMPEQTGRSLVLVTRPSGALPAPERPLAPTDAAVWGLVRTVANEHTAVGTRRISLERATPAADAAVAADAHRLALELLAPDGADGEDGAEEDEVALTANGRFVPREVPYGPRTVPAAEGDSFRIEVRGSGLSYRLAWTEADPPGPPGPGAVTVAVRAAALNYRDIMQATGLLPAEAIEGGLTQDGVGFEFAGTVTAVGEGVAGLAAGDRVAGFASGALASSLTTHASAVFPVPDGTSFAEAATMPIAFATVHHALDTVARLREGETVLVHGGAGAVGLAVVQHARLRGARVIATAGADIKRDLLRCLGVRHVFNSRTLDFAADVTRITGGRGVDVVVNSLAGEGLTRSTELLAPGGRFIELGKRDLVEDGSLPLHPLSGNALFAVVDLSTLLHRPAAAEALLEDVAEQVRAGHYRPLPHTVFPAARVAEAFEQLQHSRHIGKVIVDLDPSDDPVPVERRPAPPQLDPDGAYLVTGGLSGFGAATARHLADRGARRLALVSRRGGDAPGASALVSALAERGVETTVHAADCGDAAAMARIVEQIDRGHTGGPDGTGTGHRLRGVVHAAMHLDDEALTELPDERLAAVLAPKMAGSLVLDALTRDRDLELFCVYSSLAACLGNVRQSAYVAGNLFMEALVRRRRGDGAAGLAVAWGAISDVGYVDRNDLGAFLGSLGLEGITSAQALATLDELSAAGADVASAGHMNWGTVGKFFRVVRAARCGRLVPAGHDGGQATERLRSELAALPTGQALAAIAEELAQRIGAVLHIDPGRLDRNRRLDEYGLDSLMAAELITSLGDLFDLDISPMELLNRGGTIAGLAQFVQEQIALARPPTGAGPPPPAPRDGGAPGGPHVPAPAPADPTGSGDADAMPTSTTAGTPT